MKKIILPMALAALCGITGCFPLSLNPLYTGKDLTFDPKLPGVWEQKDSTLRENSTNLWNFEKTGEKEYRLTFTESDGGTGQFEARLLKLGDTLFLDFFPAELRGEDTKRSGFYLFHFMPTHSFARVAYAGATFQVSFLNLEWLGTFLEKNPDAIRHEKVAPDKDAPILFTASTKELQSFVLQHLNDKDAFLEPIALKRKRTEPKKE
jgi:hypothetical protein